MSECIFCFKSIENGATLLDLLFTRDVLCHECRRKLKKVNKKIYFGKYRVKAFYEYNEFYSSLLVQYKDCMDEALAPCFIFPYMLWIRIKYCGYTLVPLPSSSKKIAERGFEHVVQMFEGCKLKQCNCLIKTTDEKQVYQGKKGREKMKEYIKVKGSVKLPKRILLVDDVMTTGSTLQGALSALENKGSKIKILVVATHPLNLKK